MGAAFDRLPAKQQLFVLAVLKDCTYEQAAVEAGYSADEAKAVGIRLGQKMKIKNAISECKAERVARVKYDADRLLHRLIEIDELDVADILDDDGNVLPVKAWDSAWRRSVKEISVRSNTDGTTTTQVKLPDKLRNIELLGKHVGVNAFRADNSIELSISGIDALHAKRLSENSDEQQST